MTIVAEPNVQYISKVGGLYELIEASYRNWEDFDHLESYNNRTKIACGYPGDQGPYAIPIPASPLLMPHRVWECDGFVWGLTDLQFLCSYASYSCIRHHATEAPDAVALQPEWVTFVMNAAKCPKMMAERSDHPHFPLIKCALGALQWFTSWMWRYAMIGVFDTAIKGRRTKPTLTSGIFRVLAELNSVVGPLAAEELFDWLCANATALLYSAEYPNRCHHAQEAWNAGRKVFKELFDLLKSPCVEDLQLQEAKRFELREWPHICLRHPDSRKPQARVSFGYVTAYDIATSKERSVNIPPSLMCDGRGKLLPYSEGAKRILEFCDDFEDAEWEQLVEAFFDEEDVDDDVRATFVAFLEETFTEEQLRTLNGLEYEENSFLSLMDEDGDAFDKDQWPSVTFSLGSDVYEAVAIDPDISEVPERIKTAYWYNAYGDFGKQCWLRDRGLLSSSDEITVHEWDPAKDLNDTLHADYIKWCAGVDDDWGHAVGSYDGNAWETEIDAHDTVVNWCHWRRS